MDGICCSHRTGAARPLCTCRISTIGRRANSTSARSWPLHRPGLRDASKAGAMGRLNAVHEPIRGGLMKRRMLTISMVLLAPAALGLLVGCAHHPKTEPMPTTTPVPAPTSQTQTTPAPTTSEPAAPAPGGFTAQDLQPVFFDFDSATLTDQGRSTLDRDAKALRDHSDAKVTIEGHCDERGTAEYNQALGERRAQAAREYLVAAGIGAARLDVISYGKERPFDPGHDESAWAKNRRAHFSPK